MKTDFHFKSPTLVCTVYSKMIDSYNAPNLYNVSFPQKAKLGMKIWLSGLVFPDFGHQQWVSDKGVWRGLKRKMMDKCGRMYVQLSLLWTSRFIYLFFQFDQFCLLVACCLTLPSSPAVWIQHSYERLLLQGHRPQGTMCCWDHHNPDTSHTAYCTSAHCVQPTHLRLNKIRNVSFISRMVKANSKPTLF